MSFAALLSALGPALAGGGGGAAGASGAAGAASGLGAQMLSSIGKGLYSAGAGLQSGGMARASQQARMGGYGYDNLMEELSAPRLMALQKKYQELQASKGPATTPKILSPEGGI
jgi:hypothetical protein